MRTRRFAPIAALLFFLCAAVPLASDDGRDAGEAIDALAAYAAEFEDVFLAPFSIPTVKPFAQRLPIDRLAAFQKFRVGHSFSLDSEGRFYVDFNTSISVGVKPDMGSLYQWAESYNASDLLSGLSVFVYVRY